MSDRGGLPIPSPIDRLTAELRRILPTSQQPTAHDTPDLVDEPPAGAPAPPTAHDSVGVSEPAGAPARGLPSAYGPSTAPFIHHPSGLGLYAQSTATPADATASATVPDTAAVSSGSNSSGVIEGYEPYAP